MTRTLLISAFLFSALPIAASWSAPLQETVIFEGVVSHSLVRDWAKSPDRVFRLKLATPSSEELVALQELKGARSLQIETVAYPENASINAWKTLASQGIEWRGDQLQLPNDEQIELLNRIGFHRLTFLLTYYPDKAEAQRLQALKGEIAIIFNAPYFPRFEDRDLLRALPESIPLTFTAGYWPWYHQMDVFNMLPHAQKLFISGSFPSDEHLPYVAHLQRVTEITVDADYEPADSSIWDKMAEAPLKPRLRWLSRSIVPSSDALRAFAGKDPIRRSFVLQRPEPLESDEGQRLRDAGLSIEWIHEQ